MIREPYIKQRIPKKYFVIMFLVIAFLVGLVFYVFQKRASTGFGYLNEQLVDPKYIENPQYCKEGADCVIFHGACGSRTVNKYNFNKKLDAENIKERALIECSTADMVNQRCENNLCVGDDG